MKKLLGLVTLLVLLSGCTFMGNKANLSKNGGMSTKPLQIISRENEYALEDAGEITGESYNEKLLFFFNVAGDPTRTTVPIFGNKISNPVEKMACYKAVEENGMDAIYVISIEREVSNFIFFKKEKVKVRGRGLKMKNLGMVDLERSDKLKIIENMSKKDGMKIFNPLSIFK